MAVKGIKMADGTYLIGDVEIHPTDGGISIQNPLMIVPRQQQIMNPLTNETEIVGVLGLTPVALGASLRHEIVLTKEKFDFLYKVEEELFNLYNQAYGSGLILPPKMH